MSTSIQLRVANLENNLISSQQIINSAPVPGNMAYGEMGTTDFSPASPGSMLSENGDFYSNCSRQIQ